MATFGSASFEERGQGGGQGFQAHGAAAAHAIHIIPGGAPIVQHVATATSDLSLAAQGTESELDALRDAVGDSATLSYVGGSVTAYLKAVSSAAQILDGVDLWQWTLELVV